MAGGVRLEVEGLTRRYGTLTALDEVTFALEPGAFLVVLGPNGAGKTTLLKTLARISAPTTGEVRMDGDDWFAAPVARQREVGLLSHRSYLYDRLTAFENLRFWATLYGEKDPTARAGDALARFGLEEHAARRVGSLSRGLVQRVAIARAILHRPRLLLLDEPYAGLDPDAAARLGETLATLGGSATVVLTSHDLARAPAAATDVLVLVDGRLVSRTGAAETPPAALEALYARAVAAAAR